MTRFKAHEDHAARFVDTNHTGERVELEERHESGEYSLFVEGRMVGSFMHEHGAPMLAADAGKIVDHMLTAHRTKK